MSEQRPGRTRVDGTPDSDPPADPTPDRSEAVAARERAVRARERAERAAAEAAEATKHVEAARAEADRLVAEAKRRAHELAEVRTTVLGQLSAVRGILDQVPAAAPAAAEEWPGRD